MNRPPLELQLAYAGWTTVLGERLNDLRLFKHGRREHIESMKREGRFRFGSLADFRREELYGTEIGDHGEGTIQIEAEVWSSEDENQNTFARQAVERIFILHDETENVSVENINLEYDVSGYVFSVSENPEPSAEDGYDACIEITDLFGFFAMLSQFPKFQFPPPFVSDFVAFRLNPFMPCEYRSRYAMGHETKVPIHLIKPEAHRPWREWRLFLEIGPTPPHVMVSCIEATQFLGEPIYF